MLHRLRLILTALTFLGLILMISPGAAVAATAALTESQAIDLLRSYAIVRGDPSGALLLDQRLTRAQAAAIFIRSRGAEDLARMLADSVPFVDAKGHWAAGEIAVADRLGLMKGDGDGRFRPEDDITYAEVYTVLLRMVDREPSGTWDPYKVWAAAEAAGFSPAGINPMAPAIRGSIFWSLAVAISRVPLPNGQTVLQRYLDTEAPKLQLDAATILTKAATVAITGKSTGAVQVTVGGNPAALDRASGTFRAEVSPSLGANTYVVEALDWAGNKAVLTARVERRADIASLKIEGPAMVRAGTSHKLTVTALDPQGKALPLQGIKAEMTGDLGVFNLQTTTLVAGSKTGRGTLTLRYDDTVATYTFEVTDLSPRANRLQIGAINGGRDLTVGQQAEVRVQVLDAVGQPVTDDYWREITLIAEGAVVTPAVASVHQGVATFRIAPAGQGTVSIRALSPGLTEARTTLGVYTATRVVLVGLPASLPPDGISAGTIRAQLQDASGQQVVNTTGRDIIVDLFAASGDGVLTVPRLTIRNGSSTSAGMDAQFRAGIMGSAWLITGRHANGHDYSVVPLTLTPGPLPGAKLVFSYSNATVAPGGSGLLIDVRVLDPYNNLVTSGSYAFAFAVSTSNGDGAVNGLPPGAQLTMEGSVYRPVGGSTATDPTIVVGRTYQGAAQLRLNYDRSGILTLTPLLTPPTTQAFHPSAGYGPAAGSTAMAAQPFQIVFAGSPAQVKLTVDSPLGQSLSAGAGSPGSSFRLRATVLDSKGALVPGFNQTVVLSRVSGQGVTTILGNGYQTTSGGVAEFTLTTGPAAGQDRYVATVGNLQSVPVTVSVRNAAPETPVVAAVRGGSPGDPSPVIGYVAPWAQYLDIQLNTQRSPIAGEPNYPVLVKVFNKGTGALLYSALVDLAAEPALVQVPKSVLPRGRAIYEVSVYNGYAESSRSLDMGLSEALNAVYHDGYTLQSAWYDAESGRLFLVAGGLEGNGVLTPGRLELVRGAERLSLAGLAVSGISTGPFGAMMILSPAPGAPAGTVAVDTNRFHGAVTLRASNGWYTSQDGSQVAREVSGAPMSPMAAVSYATLDVPASRLYLHGAGFAQGSLDLTKVRIEQGTAAPVVLKPGSTGDSERVLGVTDTTLTIALSPATLNAIQGLVGSDIRVVTQVGWLRASYGGVTYSAGASVGADHLLYTRVTLSSAAYDRTTRTLVLRGSGFAGTTLDPMKLAFRATGMTAEWRPGAGFTVTVVDDTTITVMLSPEDATAFQSNFGGRATFLNTGKLWLVDANGRPAVELPLNSILFTVPN